MMRELNEQEALVVFGGQELTSPEGSWVINCTPSGIDYYRAPAGTTFSSDGGIVSGSVYPVTEGYYAFQEYRTGERNLGGYYTPTITIGC